MLIRNNRAKARANTRARAPQGDPIADIFGGALGIIGRSVDDSQHGREFDVPNLLHDLSGIFGGVGGLIEEPEIRRVPQAAAGLLHAGERIAAQAKNRDLPLERQVVGGIAAGVQAIAEVIPEDREVLPRISQVARVAENIVVAVNDDRLPLENRIMQGVALGLQGIGNVTPQEDFVTAEIGNLLARINKIVQYAKDNDISDGLKLIQCSGEGVNGIVECIIRIVQALDAIQARNSGITAPVPTPNEVETSAIPRYLAQGAMLFSGRNRVKQALNATSQSAQDTVTSTANHSVFMLMNCAYKLCGIISDNLDQDLLVLKVPPHVLAEAYIEMVRFEKPEPNHGQKVFAALMRKYNNHEATIANMAGAAFVLGAAHMLQSINYNLSMVAAAAFLAKFKDAIEPAQMKMILGGFAAIMTLKDNVLPGALLMLAAWFAVAPSLVERDALRAMVESSYQDKTRHPSLRG